MTHSPDSFHTPKNEETTSHTPKNEETANSEQARLGKLSMEISIALTKENTLKGMLTSCTKALVQHLDAAFARIWTFNTETKILELQASSGMYTHLDGPHSRVPLGALKIGLIASERLPHLTNTVIGDPRVGDQAWARREGMIAFAGYPLLVEERLIGVIALFARYTLNNEALQAMATIANGIALGIERQRTYHDLQELNATLEAKVEQRTAVLRQLNTELQRSNQELQDFAYVASHDLQEPLRKIQAFGNLLEEEYGNALGNGKAYLDRMRNAATRMRILIEDLLTFSRVTTKAAPFAQVNLNAVIQQVIDDVEPRLAATLGRIETHSLPTIEADPAQIHQLFQNLIVNALKFHRPDVPPVVKIYADVQTTSETTLAEGGTILEQAEQQCLLSIEDNGIGFDEKYLDRIFTVFQRLHGKSDYEGTGIGLAVVRKIVERHGGSVTAKSTIGNGATFSITLPFRQPEVETMDIL
jgi:signal transduction histidine kinase